MTDAFGNDLSIGDSVVYCYGYKGTFLHSGVVTGFVDDQASPRVIIGKRSRILNRRVYKIGGALK